ncbi:fumarylacetoacetate hydrolase family protein [Botrimarina sp.]|uniref:fumarylacetoacetate hydrolase family protein n=1 Tax=Botrimarina sp. TaxID=2795802 RepID=UPI0032EF4CA4
MRIVRYRPVGQPSAAPQHGVLHADGRVTRAEGDPLGGAVADTGEAADVGELLAPVEPAAILCIGLNYAEHAAEGGRPAPDRPVVFMKTPAAVQRPGGPIVLPRRLRSDSVDYEGELAVVIGRECLNAPREAALDYVAGYACGNDVSARDWQRGGGGGQWCRGKTFATFAPLGPCLVTPDELGDPGDLRIRTTVSGDVLQDSTTADMIFDVPTLIEFLSASTRLAPGTVILTGTPPGVGFARTPPRWLAPGDLVTVEIDRIGALTNPVVEERLPEGLGELDRWAL